MVSGEPNCAIMGDLNVKEMLQAVSRKIGRTLVVFDDEGRGLEIARDTLINRLRKAVQFAH